jgi:hypothetical protein
MSRTGFCCVTIGLSKVGVKERMPMMRKWYVLLMATLVCAALGHAQGRRGQAQQQTPSAPPAELKVVDGWGVDVREPLAEGMKPGPAPRHDISGIWIPTKGAGAGIQANGPVSMPSDGIHEPPYTDLGKKTYDGHKALYGYRNVAPSLSNDPRNICDPLGFPRSDFYQLRHTQILQNERQVVILYQYDRRYRIIWTDGRELPQEFPTERYYGYSVGKWVDDNTLEVTTAGVIGDPKTWLDETGRPMSDAMRVVERFRRVDSHNLELTVTVEDSKMFTKPWVAMDKFPLKLQTPDYDIIEMLCAPSDMLQYSTDFGDAASGIDAQ